MSALKVSAMQFLNHTIASKLPTVCMSATTMPTSSMLVLFVEANSGLPFQLTPHHHHQPYLHPLAVGYGTSWRIYQWNSTALNFLHQACLHHPVITCGRTYPSWLTVWNIDVSMFASSVYNSKLTVHIFMYIDIFFSRV
jgi:hypothetical protein